MFGQFMNQVGLTQWSKLMGNFVPCLTIDHTNDNPKVHCDNQHA
jgi:hypothetical protein